MATCPTCERTILIATKKGDEKYCSEQCAANRDLADTMWRVPDDYVADEALRVYAAPCPLCHGEGPVEVRRSYRGISAITMSFETTGEQISCSDCGRRQQWKAFGLTLVAGWWSLSGLFTTPVILVRNILGMFRLRHYTQPSGDLLHAVRIAVAQDYLELGKGLDMPLFLKHRDSGIFETIDRGDILSLKSLLAKEPSLLNSRLNPQRQTPLHRAVRAGHSQIVSFLLESGCDLHLRDIQGADPLLQAVTADNVEFVKLLLDRGADPNRAPFSGEHPLHLAAKRGNNSIVRILLDAGARPDVLDSRRNTPAMLAKKAKAIELSRALELEIQSFARKRQRDDPEGYLKDQTRAVSRMKDTWVIAVLIAFFVVVVDPIALYFTNSYLQNHQELHIANMLDEPVQLNMEKRGVFTVSGQSVMSVEIPEGTYRIAVIQRGKKVREDQITLGNTYFERFFTDKVSVYNVLNSSVLIWERIVCYPEGSDPDRWKVKPAWEVTINKPFIQFEDVDYVFSVPPETQETSSKSPVSETMVMAIGSDVAGTAEALLENKVEAARIMGFLESHITALHRDDHIAFYRKFSESNGLSVRADKFLTVSAKR